MYATEPSWSLTTLVPGGVHGAAWAERIEATTARVEALAARVAALPAITSGDHHGAWRDAIRTSFDVFEHIQVLHMLASCHSAAHTDDGEARAKAGRAGALLGRLLGTWTRVGHAVRDATDADLDALLEGLEGYGPWLHEQRRGQSLQLAPELQGLLVEADREALHGWCRLYHQVTARLEGAAEHVARATDPDAGVRRRSFAASTSAHETVADLCATALTHIVGTRQMRADRAGVDELAHCLHDNRIDRDVLDAMWAGVDRAQPALVRYLRSKARHLGTDALDWWDLAAPLGTPPPDATFTWSEAQRLIVDAFEAAEPELAASARRLLEEGAVEAEVRPHKRVGAFCAPFGLLRTSRIFATFSGTLESAAMVAHELGHGWHADVLYTVPMVRRMITAALAETASLYAENLVRDRGLRPTADPGERLYMLDVQLRGGVALLLNNRARHTFELECYRLRRTGPLTAPALSELMERCQREAMGDGLRTWDPLLWVKKLHFYMPRTAFNNWVYAFGYLFSGAVQRRDVRLGDLLLRTGWQDARGLARDTLGSDLADPGFWEEAAQPLVDAADELEELVESATR